MGRSSLISYRTLSIESLYDIYHLYQRFSSPHIEQLEEELSMPEDFAWSGAFDSSGRLVGTHRTLVWGSNVFLRMIYVLETERHFGIASGLTHFSISNARDINAENVLAWSWSKNNETEILASKFSLIPTNRRFFRFRIRSAVEFDNERFVRRITESEINATNELLSEDVGGMGPARQGFYFHPNRRGGYAVWGDRECVKGGFFFFEEFKWLAVVVSHFVPGASYEDSIAAARTFAAQNGYPNIDIAVPASELQLFFLVKGIGGQAVHRQSITLSKLVLLDP